MRPVTLPWFVVVLFAMLVPAMVRAQRVAVGDPLEDYARIVSLLDSTPRISFNVRPMSDTAWGTVLWDPFHLWGRQVDDTIGGSFKFTPFAVRATGNSAYAAGQNDGMLWQGKGFNTIAEIGATFRYKFLEVTLRPQIAWSANEEFPLAPVIDTGRTDYANPWHPYNKRGGYIDAPQRMGPADFAEASWGNSSIRLRSGGWAFGLSNENLWWGPAQRNPLILSNNAPGFAHVSLGTVRPVEVPGFKLETNWIWGGLENSGWSDSIPNDSTRYLTGLILSLQPNFIPGLSVGASRMFYMNTPPGGIDGGDLFLVFQGITKESQVSDSNPTGDDLADQYASLFVRYAPPASGFEAYFEFGKNDHSWDIRDLVMEPGHATGSTVGMQKVFPLLSGSMIRAAIEWTTLQKDLTQLVRATPSWYAHHMVRDGWTQQGQVLGAQIGPGSTALGIWGDYFADWGRAGLLFQHVARDNDALYQIYPGDPYDRERHQVELLAQASALIFWRGFEVEGVFSYENTLNKHLQPYNDVHNYHFELGVRKRMPRWP
jgi:hypothetical protein